MSKQALKIRPRAFTLIELMIVLVIAGVLTAGAMVEFAAAKRSSRNAERVTDVTAIASGIRMYYAEKQQYPDITQPSGTPTNCISPLAIADVPGTCWSDLSSNLTNFIASVPVPPKTPLFTFRLTQNNSMYTCQGVNTDGYYYFIRRTGTVVTEFKIMSYIENGKSGAACTNNTNVDGGSFNGAYEIFSPGGSRIMS